MKKVCCTLFSLLLLAITMVTSSFALFQYNKSEQISDVEIAPNRAQFKEVSNDYYTVIFFASPYYATGAEITENGTTTTITDPLEIANSKNNPYNSNEDYILIGPRIEDVNSYYANAHFASGDIRYISAKNVDEDKLDTLGAITPYKKKEFSGEILVNEELNINENTSTFVAKTVRGNISSDILSGIKVETKFKDKYGFGPEFVGWTYDINAMKKRTMYGENRYANDYNYTLGDTRGWGKGNADQIGNYGVQGEIAQMTSSTSLEHIDQLQGTSSDTMGIDGSLVGDHVIYLYPVFIAKNYDQNKNIGGKTTAFIKFRYDPDTTFDTEHNQYVYEYNQKAEVDYDAGRFTIGFFQKAASSFDSDPNYYSNDIYLDFSGGRNIQIDASLANGEKTWASAWSSLIDFSTLQGLQDLSTGKPLESGYYNVDISFFQYQYIGEENEEGYITEEKGTKQVQEVYDAYVASNKYCAVYGSRQNDHPETFGLQWLPMQRSGYKRPTTYVIGIQRIQQYHMTSDRFNGSINDFGASGYKTLFTTSYAQETNLFYATTNVNLNKDDEFSILIQDTTTQTIPYTLEAMKTSEVDAFNDDYQNSSGNTGTHIPLVTIGEVGDTAQKIVLVSNKKKLKANEAGNYSLIFTIEYDKGQPSKINVAYRQNLHTYGFVVLSSAPSSSEIYTNYDALRKQENFLAGTQITIFDSVTMDTSLSGRVMEDEDTSIPTSLTLKQLLENNPDKVLRDTATGWIVNPNIFNTNKFIMTRDYVLYLADK